MKRIDIYTIDIGGGHIAPAQAIKQQFDILGYKDLDVHVVNLGIELGASFLRYLYKFYWNNALRYPPLINAFYRGADNPFMIKIIDRILGITILPKFVAYLEREKPDLVVSTYFTFTHYLELLQRVGQLDATSVVLNPEPFDSHYIWFSPAFDWSMVFSRKSRDEIVEKGILRQQGEGVLLPHQAQLCPAHGIEGCPAPPPGPRPEAIHRAPVLRRGRRRPDEEDPGDLHRAPPGHAGGGHLRAQRAAADRHRGPWRAARQVR